jgi:hypothetical protein
MKGQSKSLILFAGVILGWSQGNAFCADKNLVPVKRSATSDWNRSDATGRYLRSAVARDPNNQLLHYYLANWYALNGQHIEAIKQYAIAYNLNQRGTVADYCLKAMFAYTNDSPQAKKANSEVLEKEAAINRAKARIESEGKMIGNNEVYNSEVAASYAKSNSAGRQAQAILDKAHKTMQDMRRARVLVKNGDGVLESMPAYPETLVRDVERKAQEQIQQTNAGASNAITLGKYLGGARQALIEDSASGLKTQFNPDRHGFSLSTEGTTLYIRNYSDLPSSASAPDANQEELLATPEKMILDSHSRSKNNLGPVLPKPFTARAGALPPNSNTEKSIDADLKVHGELLDRLKYGKVRSE